MKLKIYAESIIILTGFLIFIGAVFNWQWLTNKKYLSKSKGFQHFIYEFWGQKVYRIFIGSVGFILMMCGFLFLFYKN